MKPSGNMDISKLADNELATELKAGNEAAFDEIVRRHQGRVYAVAFRTTGNREDALDVAQEAFLKVHRKIHSWKPVSGFVPWMIRLTVNQSIDFVRSRKRHQHLSLDGSQTDGTKATLMSVQVSPIDTAKQVRAKEIDARIREALIRLSPAQRTVFELRHFEGMRLAEIAQAQGCTTGSVKVHLFRALKKLQVELKDLYSE